MRLYDFGALEAQMEMLAKAATQAACAGDPDKFCELTSAWAAVREFYSYLAAGGLVH